MKNILYISLVAFFIMLANVQSYGQDKEEAPVKQRYIKAASFIHSLKGKDSTDFRNLFHSSAKIVFDIPFVNPFHENEDIKRISKDDRRSGNNINLFGKKVTVDMYIENMNRYCDLYQVNIDSAIFPVGPTLKEGDSMMIFQVERRFAGNISINANTSRYIVSIDNKENKILSIRRNNDLPQFDIKLKFVDAQEPTKWIGNVNCEVKLIFEESINDKVYNTSSNEMGILFLKDAANNRTKISINAKSDNLGLRYGISDDWKSERILTKDQPEGYEVKLQPYTWNGLSYTFDLYGGVVIQSPVDLTNFSEESSFNNEPGYKFGVDFNLTYYFNHRFWRKDERKWLVGIGTGIGTEQIRSTLISDGFIQEPYPFVDESGYKCDIEFSGTELKETNNYRGVVVPLSIDIRKWLNKKSNISIEAGVNIKLSVLGSDYTATGVFSRHGYYYDFNDQPVTDDSVYNYYTNRENSYSGKIEYASTMAEAFIGFNWFISTSEKHPDRTLKLGIVASLPFTSSHSYSYETASHTTSDGETFTNTYDNYWINTENDQYHSLAYSHDRLFNYYIGFSIGINLINFRLSN